MDKFLELFAKDRVLKNGMELITSIDLGRVEFWSACFFWEDDKIYFMTQYNPPPFCEVETCVHFPRNHLDDGRFNSEGDLEFDGTVCGDYDENA